jgi:hypothetical protein
VKDDVPPEFAGTVPTWAELDAEIRKHFLIADPDALRVPLATVAAHRLPGDTVWLLIVAPPSGLKTELVTLLGAVPGAFPISELTARTFASGLVTTGDDPSLLARLTTEILLMKDFTTVLETRWDERQMILAQLREIYDGRFDKVWGTGKEVHWRGRLGFVAGVTPVIDKHHAVIAILGQRFVLFRPQQPDRRQMGARAIVNSRRASDGYSRQHLAGRVAAFLNGLPDLDPSLDEHQVGQLAALADYVTRARSAVERDRWKRELEYAPEAEMPARFARQLASLARGLALIAHRGTVTSGDLATVTRVALDAIPAVRRRALDALIDGDEDLTTSALAKQVQYSTSTLRRALEDLQSLELVTSTTSTNNTRWSLHEDWRAAAEGFAVPAKPEGTSSHDAGEVHDERY